MTQAQTKINEQELSRIPAEAVRALLIRDSADLEVFLPGAGQDSPVLYRKSGSRASAPDIARLIEHGVHSLYIRTSDLKSCEQKIEAQLDQILADPTVTPAQKADIIHGAGSTIARDLMDAPGASECNQRSARVVETMIDSVLNDPTVASYILQMAGHERSTASHMFIVSTLAILLGAEVLGEDKETLRALGIAGMVHDLGKLSIPVEILNKTTPLSREELALIQQHPIESIRLIGDDPNVSPLARKIVLQHHERPDGRGYPLGISSEELHFGSKLLTIVDSFHAMIGRRSYRTAMEPEEANRIMAVQAGKQFDSELLAIWRNVCSRRKTADFQPPSTKDQSDAGGPQALAERHERRPVADAPPSISRRPPRFECRNNTTVRCIYAGRLKSGSDAGDEFSSQVQDISRGGLCIMASHPLYRGEVVYVRLKAEGRPLWVRSIVAWCRQSDPYAYRIGLRFDRRMRDDETNNATCVEPLLSDGADSTDTTESDGGQTEADECPIPQAPLETERDNALKRLASLSAVRPTGRVAQQTAVTLAMSGDHVVRLKALEVLIKMNTPMTRDAVCVLIGDANTEIRERAVAAAGALRLMESVGALHQLLQEGSMRIGLLAAGALGCLNDDAGLPFAARVLREDVPEARIAARVVGQITGHRFSANRDGVQDARRYLEAKNLMPS